MGHFQVVLGAGANLVVSIDNRFGDPPTPDPLHSNFQVPHLNNHPGPFGSAGPGSGLAVKNESWHHIVVSRNGDQVSNIILVVDGKNITQDRWADSTDSWGITGSDAKIGTRSTAPDAQTWNGWIDEQSLWIGRQLSIKESQILFHAALGYESADFDDNSTINGADVNALVADIVAGNNTPSFDLTKDGAVNAQDLDLWLSLAGGNNIGAGRAYLPGDANLDGVVDGTDFGLWNSNKFTGNTEWTRGNFNADSVTDGSDFGVWNSNKFTASDSTLVPEPSSLISILAGVGLLMVRRRHTNCQR